MRMYCSQPDHPGNDEEAERWCRDYHRVVTPVLTGWCSTPAHAQRGDHLRTEACEGFVSDAEFTRQLMAEASEHDRHVTYSPEHAYIEQHRPY